MSIFLEWSVLVRIRCELYTLEDLEHKRCGYHQMYMYNDANQPMCRLVYGDDGVEYDNKFEQYQVWQSLNAAMLVL